MTKQIKTIENYLTGKCVQIFEKDYLRKSNDKRKKPFIVYYRRMPKGGLHFLYSGEGYFYELDNAINAAERWVDEND